MMKTRRRVFAFGDGAGKSLASIIIDKQRHDLMNPTPIPADCLTCGACCFSQLPTYVRVSGEDWSRLDEHAESVAHFVGTRAYMKMRDGHCAALAIREGKEGREYFCSVYEQRPQVCRDLARGSPQCEAELEQKADRACTAEISQRFHA